MENPPHDWLALLALGATNLAAVLRTGPGQVVQMVGLKGRWLGRLNQAIHPAMIAFVGALFALSFDTFSQTMLFSRLPIAWPAGFFRRCSAWCSCSA